jgi:hypothetical protein
MVINRDEEADGKPVPEFNLLRCEDVIRAKHDHNEHAAFFQSSSSASYIYCNNEA